MESKDWRSLAGRPRPRPFLPPILAFLVFLLLPPVLSPAAAGPPAGAVVSVVGLDEEGNPNRQGLGAVLDKDGHILTSAALLAAGRGGIVKTAGGEKQLVRRVLSWDFLQDVALIQVEGGEALPAAPLGGSRGIRRDESVWVGVRQNPPGVKEARVASVLPLSPRLVLLKLEPADLATDLGAPVFNGRGELVGMLHGFVPGPENFRVQFFLARDRSHLPAAQASAEEDRPGWPEDPEQAPGYRTSRAFWEGVAASQRQDWTLAREKFSAALNPGVTLAEAFYGRGVARFHLGDYPGAVQDLEQASRNLKGYALASLWLGRAKERQGQQEASLEAYQQAVAADPDLGEAWFQLGLTRYRQGDLAQAQECLEKGGDDFPQAAQRWWYLGIIHQVREHHPQALQAFQRARELDNNFFPAYVEEGKLLTDLGRPQEGAKLLAQVVQSNPHWGQARFHLGRAYFMSANTAGAWEQYFALQKIHPGLAIRLAFILEQNY